VVLTVNPVIALTYVPVVVPSVVLASAIVGFVLVLQQTPLAVSKSFPLELTFPPLVAEVLAIAVIAVVVKVGKDLTPVVKLISVPYPVPAELMA
jgi:hypothetical protein